MHLFYKCVLKKEYKQMTFICTASTMKCTILNLTFILYDGMNEVYKRYFSKLRKKITT